MIGIKKTKKNRKENGIASPEAVKIMIKMNSVSSVTIPLIV